MKQISKPRRSGAKESAPFANLYRRWLITQAADSFCPNQIQLKNIRVNRNGSAGAQPLTDIPTLGPRKGPYNRFVSSSLLTTPQRSHGMASLEVNNSLDHDKGLMGTQDCNRAKGLHTLPVSLKGLTDRIATKFIGYRATLANPARSDEWSISQNVLFNKQGY